VGIAGVIAGLLIQEFLTERRERKQEAKTKKRVIDALRPEIENNRIELNSVLETDELGFALQQRNYIALINEIGVLKNRGEIYQFYSAMQLIEDWFKEYKGLEDDEIRKKWKRSLLMVIKKANFMANYLLTHLDEERGMN
jgi:hypothetical protein